MVQDKIGLSHQVAGYYFYLITILTRLEEMRKNDVYFCSSYLSLTLFVSIFVFSLYVWRMSILNDPLYYDIIICSKIEEMFIHIHISLADLGGRARRTPPHRTQFFHFRIHFHQKVPTSEVHAPPNACTPPPTGNPGSATAYTHTIIMLNKTIRHYKISSVHAYIQKCHKSKQKVKGNCLGNMKKFLLCLVLERHNKSLGQWGINSLCLDLDIYKVSEFLAIRPCQTL